MWIIGIVLLFIAGTVIIVGGIALSYKDDMFYMFLAVIVGLGIVCASYLLTFRAGCGNPVSPDSLDRKTIYALVGKAEVGLGKNIVVLKDGQENITCVITSAILPDETEFIKVDKMPNKKIELVPVVKISKE